MAAKTSSIKINKLITKKFNSCFLKPYVRKHNLKLRNYKYKETLYLVPYFMYLCDYLWIRDPKKTIEMFGNTTIPKVFYDFFFSKTTQQTIYETNGKKFCLDEYENIVNDLFHSVSEDLSQRFWSEFKQFKQFNSRSVLTDLICTLLSYFYTDDIIEDFGPDINKLIVDNDQYAKKVQLFTLKLKYLKQVQNILKEIDPTHANFLIIGINVISKDHKG